MRYSKKRGGRTFGALALLLEPLVVRLHQLHFLALSAKTTQEFLIVITNVLNKSKNKSQGA
jgi:hypothetical protein